MEAGGGEAASAGSDDGVTVGRESGEPGAGSGQDLEAGDIGDLGLLDEFGLVRASRWGATRRTVSTVGRPCPMWTA